MLSNFQCGDNALLQSFLVGQPELRMLMRSPLMEQFRQRVIASYHLGPLDQADTRAYVEHRLGHVGWKGDPQFEADAFVAIHRATGGVPRKINSLCNRVFLAAYLSEKHAIGRADIAAAACRNGKRDGCRHRCPAGARREARVRRDRRKARIGGDRRRSRRCAAACRDYRENRTTGTKRRRAVERRARHR